MIQPPTAKTALITGASSGLGAEFARQLASRGYSLILTARREDRLRQLEQSIRSDFGVEIEVLPADLSQISEIEKIASMINNHEHLDLLVNNAGFGTVGKFYHVDPQKELAMLNVHVVSSVLLCRAALPAMVSRDQGALINVSSLAGLIPIRNVLYHSTKSFLVSFSETLSAELRGTHVYVQALCPGFVLTEFHDTKEYSRFSRRGIPKFLWMTADKVVKESLDGLQKKQIIVVPGRYYSIAGALARNSISAGMIRFISGLVLRKRKSSRA